jgi:hypothetical protein
MRRKQCKNKKEYGMKQILSKVINSGLLAGLVVVSLSFRLPSHVAALDNTFVPQATVVLTCQSETKTDKKITSFTNNAPAGSNVMLVEQDKNGNFSTQELAVGDTVVNTPRLFWYIKGVQLGPWEVPATIEGKCLTSESAYANQPPASKSVLPYAVGAGTVVVLAGVFIAGKKLGRK